MNKNIALHLGAHKTASTYIQRQLLRDPKPISSDNIKTIFTSNDISGLLPGQLRASGGFSNKITSLGFSDKFTQLEYDETAAILKQMISATPQNNILLSDENLIGTCRNAIAEDQLYPYAHKRLELVNEMLAGNNVGLFIAVRETSSFITSAYCENTRAGQFCKFRDYIRKIEQFDSLWYDFLKRVKSIFKDCPVYVWDYQSTFDQRFMIGLFSKMFSGVNDLSFLNSLEINRDTVNPSMDAKALRLLNAAEGLCSRSELIQLKNFLDKKITWEEPEKFCEWSSMEKDYISSEYQKDLDKIKRDEDFIFLEPTK